MSIQQELSQHKQFPLLQNQQMEAIVLAGGFGTRLRSAVPDLPKCMASVAGRPFLYYVINYLRMQGIEKIIFSLGYMHEKITDWLQQEFSSLSYEYVIEEEPLGTGGAIQFAMQKTTTENVFVANGDTMFGFDAKAMLAQHIHTNAACTLALKPMQNFDRYGAVTLNETNTISSFKEKQFYTLGLINAGIYLINKSKFLNKKITQKFSFEKNYLEAMVTEGNFFGISNDAYFIDIGIPEDYKKAQSELKQPELNLSNIDSEWTLFLDRDGVINHDKPGGYITTPEDFHFVEGLPELFKQITHLFKRIIIVTNQRGVGRGIIQHDNLLAMNKKMIDAIIDIGGIVHKIYYCTDTESDSFYRKPNPGMALTAVEDFPDIDLTKSLIVGNSISDMKLGRYAGIRTIFVRSTNKNITLPHPDIDLIFENLQHFVHALKI